MKINGSPLRRNPGAPARPDQAFSSLNAELATLTVAVDKPGHAISPTLYGIFFEDINCSADGGLYAEMVRNRNFEDSTKPDNWSAESSEAAIALMTLDSSEPALPKNLHSLKVEVTNLL